MAARRPPGCQATSSAARSAAAVGTNSKLCHTVMRCCSTPPVTLRSCAAALSPCVAAFGPLRPGSVSGRVEKPGDVLLARRFPPPPLAVFTHPPETPRWRAPAKVVYQDQAGRKPGAVYPAGSPGTSSRRWARSCQRENSGQGAVSRTRTGAEQGTAYLAHALSNSAAPGSPELAGRGKKRRRGPPHISRASLVSIPVQCQHGARTVTHPSRQSGNRSCSASEQGPGARDAPSANRPLISHGVSGISLSPAASQPHTRDCALDVARPARQDADRRAAEGEDSRI